MISQGQVPLSQPTRPHQLGQAPLREDTAWATEVQVARAPASHVEPLHCAGGAWTLFFVQQDQLLLGSHSCALQHLLQLEESNAGKPEDPAQHGAKDHHRAVSSSALMAGPRHNSVRRV